MQSGGFVTPHLYIPKQMWTQNGIKLIHLGAKVRMVNLVLYLHFELVDSVPSDYEDQAEPIHGFSP